MTLDGSSDPTPNGEVAPSPKEEDESEVTKEDTDGSDKGSDSESKDSGKTETAQTETNGTSDSQFTKPIRVESVKPNVPTGTAASPVAKPFRPKSGPAFLKRLRRPPIDLPTK